jgi:outer membrane protein assembly factor BamB
MVFTAGQGIVEARDQYSGNLIWSKAFPWTDTAEEPADTPDDWCYGDIPTLGSGNTGVCYVADLSQCPSWCLECTTTKPDCSSLSVINPLRLGEGYGQFLTTPTLDPSRNLLAFGTFDGRVIALNMETGATVWERTPFKDPGGPNEGRPWYDQKFAWHLSAPSIANGHVYIGSFLPSFYYIFRYPPFGKAIYGSDFHTYWMGHDGWFYALDENDGSILWTWNPPIPPMTGAMVIYRHWAVATLVFVMCLISPNAPPGVYNAPQQNRIVHLFQSLTHCVLAKGTVNLFPAPRLIRQTTSWPLALLMGGL